jgi:5'-methylthioadenosine phosphorylase
VTVDTVVACLKKNAGMAQEIVRRAVATLDPGSDCPCQHALATAIMTDRAAIRPAQRKKLGLLIGKYV